MKNILVIFVLCIATINGLFAQTLEDKKSVTRAMYGYLEGFYEGDSIKIINSISPDVAKFGYWENKRTKKYDGEAMSFKEMIEFAIETKTKHHEAKPGTIKKVEVYDVQDQTASGKVTAWWGTDYILLEKVNGKWMIRMVLWQGPLKK